MITATREIQATGQRSGERPVFSANQLGRVTLQKHELERRTSAMLVDVNASAHSVNEIYEAHAEADFLPVAHDGTIVGYLRRQMFRAKLSETTYSRELLMRDEVTAGSVAEPRVVLLDAFTTLSEASDILMSRDEEIRFDPFVVTLNEEFYGISSVRRVLEGLNKFLQMDSHACDRMQKRIMEPLRRAVEETVDTDIVVNPLHAPGGDYADVFELNERYTLAVLFDVCGKGLKASAMVNSTASVLKTLILGLNRDRIDMPVILGVMRTLNKMLYILTCEEMYATGVALIIDKERMILSALDYGHGFLWMKRRSAVHRLSGLIHQDIAMPFIGIQEDLEIPVGHFRLREGDVLFACSDGIAEGRNRSGEEYGEQRIRSALRRLPAGTAHTVNTEISADWTTFVDGARRTDDISMLSVVV